jgi:hypothetical protein
MRVSIYTPAAAAPRELIIRDHQVFQPIDMPASPRASWPSLAQLGDSTNHLGFVLRAPSLFK